MKNAEFNDLLILIDTLDIQETMKGLKSVQEIEKKIQEEQVQKQIEYHFDLNEKMENVKKANWHSIISLVGNDCLNGRFNMPFSVQNTSLFGPMDRDLATKEEKELFFNHCSSHIESVGFESKNFPFLFQSPARSISDRLKIVTREDPEVVVYIPLSEQERVFELCKTIILYHVHGLIFGHWEDHDFKKKMIPVYLELFETPHLADPRKLLSIFATVSFFKEEQKKMHLWYQEKNMTFVHQPKEPHYDEIESCLYLLNDDQKDEIKIYFYLRFYDKVCKLTKSRSKVYNPDRAKLIRSLQRQIEKIKQW